MHKSLVATLFLSGTLLFAAPGQAQNGSFAPRRAQTFAGSSAQPLASASQNGLASQISTFLAQRGIFVPASSIVVSGDAVAVGNGQRVYRLTQEVGGLQVYGVSAKAAVSSNGDLVFLTQNFAVVAGTPQGAAGNEGQALRAALNALYPGQAIGIGAARREANSVVFGRTPFFHADPRVTHVLFEEEDGSLQRALLVETWSNDRNLLHESLVGAGGNVIGVVSRTATDSYNVYVEDPLKSGQAIVNGPAPGGTLSPEGWLGSGAQTTNHIVGNNTDTYLDTDNNNAADSGGTAVTTGAFTTAANLAQAPTTPGNKAVAVQNLFYLTNRVHDDLYQHGFNEAAGNFQTNNFGKGGAGNDAVLAEAQDGGGTDNANFSTPADGSKPRMQMYLWSGDGPTHEVLAGIAYPAAGADFGAKLTTNGVTGNLALMVPADGCTAATVSLTGKVAIIDRGTCNFDVKVKNAQSAGAIAAIVANNAGDDYFTMAAGTAKRVTIPAVMVGLSSGTALKGKVGTSATERLKSQQPLQLDGAIDSDIVFHEYGHGLTWRMIGSMSGVLAGAIGEGASDVNAFLLNGDDKIGEYAYSNPAGIRRAPYTNYPYTYSYVGSGAKTYEVHNDGEIYAAAMWRLKELANPTISDDQLRDYFVKAMNFTAAAPAFEDMRDGLLQVVPTDQQCLVWRAFAKYGIGVGANGTVSRRGVVSITESFAVPSGCPAP